MKNKIHIFEIIVKIFSCTFKIIPVKSIVCILYYIINSIYPAINVLTLTHFFNAAYDVVNGTSNTINRLLFLATIFIGMFILNMIIEFIYISIVRIGVFEQCSDYYDIQLSKITSDLDLICFEDTEFYNDYILARNCVNGMTIPNTYISILSCITSVFNIVFLILTLSEYNSWFIVLSVLSVLPYFLARIIRGKKFYKLNEKQASENRKMEYYWSLFTQCQSAKEMRVMGFGDYIMDKWKITRDEVNRELWQHESSDIKIMSLCDFIRILAYALCVVFAMVMAINGHISIGVVSACLTAFSNIQNSFMSLLITTGNLPEQLSLCNNYFRFFKYRSFEKGCIPFEKFEKSISMNSISFQYPNSTYKAIDDVSCRINKGEIVAIVGENGSGKSTLSKLILGLYTPEGNQIYYDDQPLNTIDKNVLYKNISLVTQNYVQYNLTLRENIGISDVSRLTNDEAIEKAMSHIGIDYLINELNGLDTEMGREFGGAELSGGQWQKVSIARSLFKEFDFIVMDEPTSALDPLIEYEILSSFISVAKGKTAVIVSHRVGLCKVVDKIIVMKKGQIVGIGTHKELIKSNEEYQRLYRAQQKWYINT